MEKMNFIIFIYMILLTFSYAQLHKQNLNLNPPRKLEENTNETILLGYENYNYNSTNKFVYFDTLFLLKNWKEDNLKLMSNGSVDNFNIDSVVYYNEKPEEPIRFTCENNNEWFKKKYYNEYSDKFIGDGYCIAKYRCESNMTDKSIPKKINITTNFTNIDLNDVAKISYVSSSAEALEKDLVSLKSYHTETFKIFENVNFTSQSPNSFKIKTDLDEFYDSENIYLITTVNGSPKKILCYGKSEKDNSDDEYYYILQSKGSNNLAGANLNYALLNYTTKDKVMAILDFAENSKNANGTILPPKVGYKKNSGGLSTGGIVAIIIPAVFVLLGVGALAFFLSRRAVPSPPIKNFGNNTMGVVASSEAVVHQ